VVKLGLFRHYSKKAAYDKVRQGQCELTKFVAR